MLTGAQQRKAVLPAGYMCVASPQLVGLLLLVFVAPEKERRLAVTSVSTSSVGTGLLGYIGNKGAVAVRIVLGDTLRLSFVNCHLAAFANAVGRRNWDASEIAKRMAFNRVAESVVGLIDEPAATTAAINRETLDTADVVLWFGDLNYRIDLKNDDVRSLLQPYMPHDPPPPSRDGRPPPVPASSPTEPPSTPTEPPPPPSPPPHSPAALQGTLESLLEHDQLLKQRREGKAFAGYKEARITFLPTYKYDVGMVGVWDSSEKTRVPSWCDRILWRLKEPASDHKPRPDSAADVDDSPADPPSPVLGEEAPFEVSDNSDSDQEDLVVSTAKSALPLVRAPPTPATAAAAANPTLPKFDYPIFTIDTPFGEVRLVQTSYTSHQKINSSDHKPISATFHLTYPAVDLEERSKVHADVAREIDKLENERRPVVTVVIDHPESGHSSSDGEDGVIDFGHVRLWESKRRNMTVANTGTSKAKVRFVGRPSSPSSPADGEVLCKPWIAVDLRTGSTQTAELQPGEVVNISVTLRVCTVQHVLALNDKRDSLDDVLVLRVEGGRDIFIPILAKWQYSSYGTTLKELTRIPENVGGFRGYREAKEKQQAKEGPQYSAPREIYRTTQFLCDILTDITTTLGPDESVENKRWFLQLGWPFLEEPSINPADGGGGGGDRDSSSERRRMVEMGVWEALDTDRDFDDPACLRVAMDVDQKEVGKEELAEAVAGVFLCWLEGLSDGVVPETMWDEIVKAGGEVKASEQVGLLPRPLLLFSLYIYSLTTRRCSITFP